MADPLKLQAFTRQSIRAAIAKLPNVAAWEVAMRRALTQAHTTAHLIGLSERLRVPLDSALLSRTRLSRAERADITKAVKAQLDYLKGYKEALPDMSDAAIAARADLYSGAVRGSYYSARYPSLPAVPGDGSTPCRSGCKCTLEQRADGVWWILGAAEHCTGCQERAAGSPYQG
jgi:hypothetical protein